ETKRPTLKTPAANMPAAKPLEPAGVTAAVRPAVSAVPAKPESDAMEPAVDPAPVQKPAAEPVVPKAAAPATKQPATSSKPAVGQQHASAATDGKGSRMRQQFAQSNAPDETFFAFN